MDGGKIFLHCGSHKSLITFLLVKIGFTFVCWFVVIEEQRSTLWDMECRSPWASRSSWARQGSKGLIMAEMVISGANPNFLFMLWPLRCPHHNFECFCTGGVERRGHELGFKCNICCWMGRRLFDCKTATTSYMVQGIYFCFCTYGGQDRRISKLNCFTDDYYLRKKVIRRTLKKCTRWWRSLVYYLL